MVLILIFGLTINFNYVSRDSDLYLDYALTYEDDSIRIIKDFVYELDRLKDEYYHKIDSELSEDYLSFLNYLKQSGIRFPNGEFSISDFYMDDKLSSNGDKILYYYSDENQE